jgi:hypothetical protein
LERREKYSNIPLNRVTLISALSNKQNLKNRFSNQNSTSKLSLALSLQNTFILTPLYVGTAAAKVGGRGQLNVEKCHFCVAINKEKNHRLWFLEK